MGGSADLGSGREDDVGLALPLESRLLALVSDEEEELGEEFDIWWRWSCWRGREEEKERHCEC